MRHARPWMAILDALMYVPFPFVDILDAIGFLHDSRPYKLACSHDGDILLFLARSRYRRGFHEEAARLLDFFQAEWAHMQTSRGMASPGDLRMIIWWTAIPAAFQEILMNAGKINSTRVFRQILSAIML